MKYKHFTKSDLDTGMRVQYKNGDIRIVMRTMDDEFTLVGDRGLNLSKYYTESLSMVNPNDSNDTSIVKVWAEPSSNTHNLLDEKNRGELLWEDIQAPEYARITKEADNLKVWYYGKVGKIVKVKKIRKTGMTGSNYNSLSVINPEYPTKGQYIAFEKWEPATREEFMNQQMRRFRCSTTLCMEGTAKIAFLCKGIYTEVETSMNHGDMILKSEFYDCHHVGGEWLKFFKEVK